MPELPEVETTLRGIAPHIVGQRIVDIKVRCPQLRWPIPPLKKVLQNEILQRVWRRGKYLLFGFKNGTLILHLGMSGRLRILSEHVDAQKHDHVDIIFENNTYLRFTDPRRFGALLWTNEDPATHLLLAGMGPEPLTNDFNGNYLWQKGRKKKVAIKIFLMNSKVVAGIGNIYAAEALFLAGIRPQTLTGKLSLVQAQKLVEAIKQVLRNAITKGGTTLKDFRQSNGLPGYFYLKLKVYGCANKACPRCKSTLKFKRIGQRGTVYCPQCQK